MANQGGDEGTDGATGAGRRPATTGRVTPKGTTPNPKGASTRAGGTRSGSRSAARQRRTEADAAPQDQTVKATATGARPPAAQAAPASRRYTPPVRKEVKVSPPWVPILMFTLLGLGVAVIILNYLEVLPGGADNLYLLAGLAAITGGFVTATQYR